MKIAVISDHIPSKWAHSINCMSHAQAFYKLGHQVEILCIQRYLEKKNKLKIKNIHEFYGINKNIKIKFYTDFLPSFFREFRLIGPFCEYITNFFIKKLLKTKDFFIIEKKISHYCKKNNIDFTYCRRTEQIAYYNILNNIPTVIESHLYLTDIPSNFNKLISINENENFRCLITISNLLKERFEKIGFPNEKIMVLEDAVFLDEYDSINENKAIIRKNLGLTNNKKIILHSGNLYMDRGIDTILNSANNLRSRSLQFCFLGAKEKDIKYWKKYISRNNIQADILFLGFKTRNLVPFYLKAADILLIPYSAKLYTAKWMSPLKIYEYMASNTPIIASNLIRLREICNNNECLFFDSDNPDSLSEKIQTLLNNSALQQKLVKNAYKNAQNHSFKDRCKKILELS